MKATGQRYFYDTEFWEAGAKRPIYLLSIGIVAEDGREYYAANADVPWRGIETDANTQWLRENVIPHLGPVSERRTPGQIKQDLLQFFSPMPSELWAYFADYDHVVLSQIFGRMVDLPKGMPMFTHDLKQEMERRGIKREWLPVQEGTEHNALDDARWLALSARLVLGADVDLDGYLERN